MADGEALYRGVSVPFDRLLLRQLLLCSFLSFFCLLGGLVSQVVHTGSVVILRLQVLHLPAHEHQANHVQDDNHGQEAVKDHIHGGHVGERAGDADEQGVNKYPGENCTVKYAGKTISFKTAKGRSYQLKYDKENGLTQIRQ